MVDKIHICCQIYGNKINTLFKVNVYENYKKISSYIIKNNQDLLIDYNQNCEYFIVASCFENTHQNIILKRINTLQDENIIFIFYPKITNKIRVFFYEENYLLPISKGEIFLWQNHIKYK